VKPIYEPKGRAWEYAPLACNLWLTCSHGCKYCYVPPTIHKSREDFHIVAPPRQGVLEALRKQVAEFSGDPRSVLLCFTCDPYQPHEDGFTRKAIEIFVENDVAFTVLTKGGSRALRDLDLLAEGRGTMAVSSCWMDDDLRRQWEPGASPAGERLWPIKVAHKRGIPTWLSVEPVIEPEQALELIEYAHPFCNEIRVGKLNYHPHAKTIDWAGFACEAHSLLSGLPVRFTFKEDLAVYLK